MRRRGWGTPKCGLINQLAVNSPTTPASFAEVQIHISNGDDGIRDDSSASLSVYLKDKYLNGLSNPVITNQFHAQNDTGWDDKGVVHDLGPYAFPMLVPADAIDHVSFTLTSHDSGTETDDNWSIAGLDVRLTNPTGVELCQIDQEGYQLGRLTGSSPTQDFPVAGCSRVNPLPPAVPVTELEFIFGTGDDDLRQSSELDVAFYAPVSPGSSTCKTTPFEQGVLKPQGPSCSPPSFDNYSQHSIYYTFTTGPDPLADLCGIGVTLVSHDVCFGQGNDDEWHVYGMNVMAEEHGSPQNCFNDTQGEPLDILNHSNPTMLLHHSGCP